MSDSGSIEQGGCDVCSGLYASTFIFPMHLLWYFRRSFFWPQNINGATSLCALSDSRYSLKCPTQGPSTLHLHLQVWVCVEANFKKSWQNVVLGLVFGSTFCLWKRSVFSECLSSVVLLLALLRTRERARSMLQPCRPKHMGKVCLFFPHLHILEVITSLQPEKSAPHPTSTPMQDPCPLQLNTHLQLLQRGWGKFIYNINLVSAVQQPRTIQFAQTSAVVAKAKELLKGGKHFHLQKWRRNSILRALWFTKFETSNKRCGCVFVA